MLSSEKLKTLRQMRESGRNKYFDYFIPGLSPHYLRPKHLLPYTQLIDAINHGEKVRAVLTGPPRHGKTETTLHVPPFLLKKHPRWTIGYGTYNEKIAHSKSRIAMQLAEMAGVQLETRNVTEWRTKDGGGFLPAGVGGTLTGYGLNVGVIDDPVKNRVEAESAHRRETIVEWFRSTFMTRMEPNASVIVTMTRWHTDDLAGHCIKNLGWDEICLPAISDEGIPLWPERWTLEELLDRKADVGEYVWASLYQGKPKPRGGTVFSDPYAYKKLPNERKVAIGIDMAYTKSTAADYSVIVVMAFSNGYYFIVDVVRVQVRPPEFAVMLRNYEYQFPTANVRWYASGTEKGVASFMPRLDITGGRGQHIDIQTIAPRGDKFTRALPYAAAWNAGKVLVPEESDCPWVNQFLAEHATFTGVEDTHDDQVDAAVAAFDLLAGGTSDWADDDVSFPRRL